MSINREYDFRGYGWLGRLVESFRPMARSGQGGACQGERDNSAPADDYLHPARMRKRRGPNAVSPRGLSAPRNALEQGMLVEPSDSDWELAWQTYERGDADRAGIVDHVSFVVMRRLGLTQAFTNDRHFRAAGFQTLF
jgi:hypothetical protein